MALLQLLLLFPLVTAGLAWPLVARRPWLDPAERVVAAGGLSLVGLFLLLWLTFIAELPPLLLWIAPAVATVGLMSRRTEARRVLAEPAARELLIGQLLVTLTCVSWLAWIRTVSGGAWTGDWIEHWLRSRYLLEHGPVDAKFIGSTFTARPPLANGLTAAFLALTRLDFSVYTFATTLISSLAFAPAALLARRWGGTPAIAATVVLFMLNPAFLQNATHPWTKLTTAGFVLAAVHFFLRTREAPAPQGPAVLAALLLTAGLLAHYSAGPYVLVMGAAWVVLVWRRRDNRPWRVATLAAATAAALLLAVWFGWAVVRLGPASTFLSNTSVQSALPSAGEQFARILLNVRDTLVPHLLRTADPDLIAQAKPWGWWRDAWFMVCQLNVPLMLGSTTWLVLAYALAKQVPAAPRRVRFAWVAAIATVIVVGIAVVGERDVWGLAHVCLQPLILAGLAFVAARLPQLPRPAVLLLLAGAVVDATLGVFLQFGSQNLAFDRWFTSSGLFPEAALGYSRVAVFNAGLKHQVGLIFFGDLLFPVWPLVALAPAALLAAALWRSRRHRNTPVA